MDGMGLVWCRYEDPNFGVVTRTTTLDMSPTKYHFRLPFFSKEVNNTARQSTLYNKMVQQCDCLMGLCV